ncbi:MAG: hypothetical protein U1E87_01580 [Alphaproteobacteria bacterium]
MCRAASTPRRPLLHVYRSGINLYFTFAVIPGDKAKMRDVYEASWRAIMEATAEAAAASRTITGSAAYGGPISTTISAPAGHLLRTLKQALDPRAS